MRKPPPAASAFSAWTDLMLKPARAMLESLQDSLKARAPTVGVIPDAEAPTPRPRRAAAKAKVRAKPKAKGKAKAKRRSR